MEGRPSALGSRYVSRPGQGSDPSRSPRRILHAARREPPRREEHAVLFPGGGPLDHEPRPNGIQTQRLRAIFPAGAPRPEARRREALPGAHRDANPAARAEPRRGHEGGDPCAGATVVPFHPVGGFDYRRAPQGRRKTGCVTFDFERRCIMDIVAFADAKILLTAGMTAILLATDSEDALKK